MNDVQEVDDDEDDDDHDTDDDDEEGGGTGGDSGTPTACYKHPYAFISCYFPFCSALLLNTALFADGGW